MSANSKKQGIGNTERANIPCSWNGKTLKISVRYRMASEKTIVCIHGLGCSKAYFHPAFDAPELREFSVYTIDLPGFGDSPYTEQFSCSVSDCASLILTLLGVLKISSTHLICHSWGGAIGIELCNLLRDRALSMLNLEGNLVPEDCFISRQLVEDWKARETSQSDVEEVASKLETYNLPFEATEFRRSDYRAVFAAAVSLLDVTDNGNLLDKFCALTIPHAYVYGDKNEETAAVKILHEKNIPTYRISGSGHSMMVDNVSEFYATTGEFLRPL